MTDLWALPFTLQVGLAAGYIGYVTAYAGRRQHHSPADAAFISLAFGAPAILPQMIWPTPPLAGMVLALMGSLAIAMIWRGWGRGAWGSAMRYAGVHMDDGLFNAWQAVLSHPGLQCDQISVHTTDGRVLYLNDRSQFRDAPNGGLLLGTDGSILMAVEQTRMPDGTELDATGITAPVWGTRMTYIPAHQIVQINIRYL